MKSDQTRFYTIQEVAQILKVRPRTVYRILKHNPPVLHHIWVGKLIRIPEEALEQFVQQGGVKKCEAKSP